VLVLLERRSDDIPPPALRAFVHGAFAHRRKALPRSLEIWASQQRHSESGPKSLQLHTGDKGLRDRTRAALAALGHPEDVRAERLTPAQLRELWERVEAGA
jgi:16S rRNA (adenine1518-N6/adenine1519-N6)-dimethyltransferase